MLFCYKIDGKKSIPTWGHCVCFLWVLQFPSTAQKYEVNWHVYIDLIWVSVGVHVSCPGMEGCPGQPSALNFRIQTLPT